MSSYPSPVEEKKPSFWRRPVPMWAFILLVVIIILILFIPGFFTSPPPTIQQPLVLSPDSRTMYITTDDTIAANFTVTNLNTTNTISATAKATLYYFSNSTEAPATANITLMVYGVYTGTSFAAAGTGNTVSFQPGGNTLVIDLKAQNARPALYTITVALTY
jgi:hypothetical protein